MRGLWGAVCLALTTTAAASDTEVASLAHRQLAVGQPFEIETVDCYYRGHLVDRATGECRLATSADGTTFSQPRTVYVLGATIGPQARQTLVLMHEVKVGAKMELGFGDLDARNRQLSSEVKAIRLGS